MSDFIVKLLVNALAVFLVAYLLKGVEVKGFGSAILTALLLSVINALIRPILLILTIPITIITLGLFILVLDALLLMLVDKILPGLKIRNFGWALVFSLVLSLTNSLLSWIIL